MSTRISLACLLALACTGCHSTPPEKIVARQTRELPLPFDEAFDASKNALFTSGHTITFCSKEEGILSSETTETEPSAYVSVGLWVIVPMLFFGVDTYVYPQRVSLLLTPLSADNTRLRIVIEDFGEDVTEDELVDKILHAIEAEAGIPASG